MNAQFRVFTANNFMEVGFIRPIIEIVYFQIIIFTQLYVYRLDPAAYVL